jgi:hypothetical protein
MPTPAIRSTWEGRGWGPPPFPSQTLPRCFAASEAGWLRTRSTRSLLPAKLLLAALCILPACGSGDGGSKDAGVILLGNENNYRSTSTLSIPTVETAAATDLDICWGGVTSDIQCHAVAPLVDIDNVSLLRFMHLTEAQVEAKLVSGELTQSQIDGYVESRADHISTCTKLSAFSFFGTVLDVAAEYQETVDETYMLLFAKGTQPGVGARVMTFIKPTSLSTNTKVEAVSGCGSLDFKADLLTPKKVAIPAAGPWIVDWRNLTLNGQGNMVIYATIDKLLIGFYQGMTVAEVSAKFLDIELLATSLWELPLEGGRTADLSSAKERTSGLPFAGFGGAGEGVWLLGLLCSTCQNPSPVLMTVLDPGKGG